MDLELAGKTAVVTGGASGIGAATVRRLMQEGVHTAVWDMKAESQDTGAADNRRLGDSSALAATGIRQQSVADTPAVGVRATSADAPPESNLLLPVCVDITSLTQVEAAWKLTEARLGPIDILVHAAAIGSGYFGFPYYDVPVTAWSRVLEVNVVGMANVAQVAGPSMAARGSGSMVFIASVAGQIGSQTDPPYSASKAANINFAQCMARDLAGHRVRVNTVCPGMIQTPLNRSVWQAWFNKQPPELQRSYEDWAGQKVQTVVPLQRWQQPQNIADMIVFLSSPRASEVTGQTINVDGGTVMHW